MLTQLQLLCCWLHREGNRRSEKKCFGLSQHTSKVSDSTEYESRMALQTDSWGFHSPSTMQKYSCYGSCCRPSTLWHREEMVQTTDSWSMAHCTYTGFDKCLGEHLWSLIPILNHKLRVQVPQLYQNYLLAWIFWCLGLYSEELFCSRRTTLGENCIKLFRMYFLICILLMQGKPHMVANIF